MKKSILIALVLLGSVFTAKSQSEILINTNDPNSSAVLDIISTDKGLLIPRLSTSQRSDIESPDTGLIVYDNTLNQICYFDGSGWILLPVNSNDNDSDPANELISSAILDVDSLKITDAGGTLKVDMSSLLNVLRDSDKDTKIQTEESTDEDKIRFDLAGTEKWIMQGSRLEPVNSGNSVFIGDGAGTNDDLSTNNNVFIGYQAGKDNITGQRNIAIGYQNMFSNTTGHYNTAIGYTTLYNNISGTYNTVVGYSAMGFNSTGSHNTALGGGALSSNTNGSENTAIGYQALSSNTTGEFNTAAGYQSLFSNTTGKYNMAYGGGSLYSNSTGWYNTAVGRQALWRNISGNNNTGYGYFAVAENTTGASNTGLGYQALYHNKTGTNNVAIGENAGFGSAAVDLNQCTFVGSGSYPTVSRTNVTMLGYGIANAQCTGDNQVLLGNTSIAQIRAMVTSITAYSDARFKTNIRNDVSGLDFILELNPVTYNQDPEKLHDIWETPEAERSQIDHSHLKKQRYIGFLGQDVEQAARKSDFNFPGIDVPENEKEVYTLRYIDFIMPMVKAIQEQQELIKTLQEKVKAQDQINQLLVEQLQRLQNEELEFSSYENQ